MLLQLVGCLCVDAYIVMACMVMAYTAMAYIVRASVPVLRSATIVLRSALVVCLHGLSAGAQHMRERMSIRMPAHVSTPRSHPLHRLLERFEVEDSRRVKTGMLSSWGTGMLSSWGPAC